VIEFLDALGNPDYAFLRTALLMGVLSSVAFGVVGTFVVARRLGYLSGAIAHASFGGVGFAVYANRVWGWEWMDPFYGALMAAILAAIVMGLVKSYLPDREDTIMGALWSSGMALGVLLMALSPGYSDPMSYLFGNLLLVSDADLIRVAVLDAVVVVIAVFYYRHLEAISFDDEFARLRGVNAGLFYGLLLILISLTVVLLVSVVGIILVVALLTLPAALAGRFSHSLQTMMVGSVVTSMVLVVGGLGMSFQMDAPVGPVVVLFAGVAYGCVLLFTKGR